MARRRKKSGGLLSAWADIKADYTRFLRWNAKRRTTNNRLKADRMKARKTIASEKAVKAARKREARTTRLTEAEERKRARAAAFDTSYEPIYADGQPVRQPTMPAPARRPVTAGGSAGQGQGQAQRCGAKTRDGGTCDRLGECGIHKPKGPTRTRPKTTTASRGPAGTTHARPARQRTPDPNATDPATLRYLATTDGPEGDFWRGVWASQRRTRRTS